MTSTITDAIAEITSASNDNAEHGERGIRILRDFQHLEYGTKLYAHPAQCLHQIQESAPVLAAQPAEVITALWEAIGHHSAQVAETGEMAPGQKLLDAARAVEMAIRPPAIAQAASAAVAVPDGWKLVPKVPTLAMGWAYLDKAREVSPDSEWIFSHPGYEAALTAAPQPPALAATPAADAPLYAEMLVALQSVGMDAVGVGGGENAISNAARAKVDAVLEKIGAPWPSPAPAAAAPVVLPEPDGIIQVWGTEGFSKYGPGAEFLHADTVRALLATATGLPAQAVPLKLIEAINTACGGNAWQGDALVTDLLEPACRAIASLSPQAQADARDAGTTPVLLGAKLFSFYCFQDWVNRAQRRWKQARVSSENTICLDQKGRVLKKGLEFQRADKEGAFPVDVYLALVDDTERYNAAIAAAKGE